MVKKPVDKKVLEHYILTKFISNIELGLRIKKIIEHETPDFIIEEITKTFSVELTRLIHPQLMQKEAFQEKIVNIAHQRFREKYSADLYVLVNFGNIPHDANANAVNDLANELFEVVEKIWLANHSYEFRLTNMGKARKRGGLLDSISVSNNLEFDNWQPFGAFRVDQVNSDWIRQVILQKEKNLNSYGHLYDENWLLLASNFGHKSSTHDFYFFQNEELESDFDHIFLYRLMNNTFTRLK